MDHLEKDNNSDEKKMSSEEEVKELLKTIAIHETKSAIAKIKLAKFAVVKGAKTLGKGAKKLSVYIEQKINDYKEK